MNLNEFDEAMNDFKKVLLIEPTNQEALNRMREFVDYFYQNPSKFQKMREVQEIPNFVTEYMNKYGKNDYRRLYHLIIAYIGFCGTSSQSLDEQVYSV